jgi:hypothetical protein
MKILVALPVMCIFNICCVAQLSQSRETNAIVTEIASYGFLVIANGTTQGQTSEVLVAKLSPERSKPGRLFEAIDWAVTQSKDPKSTYYGRIAADMIAASGQSCGALEALVAAFPAACSRKFR